MDCVEFDGKSCELLSFAHQLLKHSATIEDVGPFERRLRWEAGGTNGFGSSSTLRTGLKVNVTRLSWDRPWAFELLDAPTPLKFTLGRGPGPRMILPDGTCRSLGGGVLQVRRVNTRALAMCEFVDGGSAFEQLAVEISPQRLRDLTGSSVLPDVLERMLASSAPSEMHEQLMAPGVSRIMDEFLYEDSRGPSRQLFLEARGLELLAAIIDELNDGCPQSSPLCRSDRERIERARHLLKQRMVAPPSLLELARSVGINECKLKSGFRTMFGNSVFSYLRAERMEEARRLLVQRDGSVTEVAVRVGYANPSKFAAAFRKHFGFPPSALR